MSMLFDKLNGFNDPTLKLVFITSLPKELQLELQRKMTIKNLEVTNLSLGKIPQLTINCLERLCDTNSAKN